MDLVNREGVGLGRQKITALTKHHRLQVQFDGMAVHENDRRNIRVGERAGVQSKRPRQSLRSFVKGPGVKEEVFRRDVAAVHDGIVWP